MSKKRNKQSKKHRKHKQSTTKMTNLHGINAEIMPIVNEIEAKFKFLTERYKIDEDFLFKPITMDEVTADTVEYNLPPLKLDV